MSEIYLVEKLWTDPLENEPSLARGYSIVGYTTSQDAATFVSPMVKENGWPITRPMPLYKIRKVGIIELSKLT